MSVLGLDLGTSGCKAAAFSLDGKCHGLVYREYPAARTPAAGFVLDAARVWKLTKTVLRGAARAAADAGDPVTALSVSSFGEAVVPVTRHRDILSDSILSCDPRGGEYVEALKKEWSPERFYRVNPNILSANYSMPKLAWTRDRLSDVYRQADYFLLWADFVCFMLGAGPFATASLANRTLLFDLGREDWSEELFRSAGLDREKFPRVVSAGVPMGTVSPKLARELGLSAETTIVSGGHDQCCNALGAGCFRPGGAVCGVGTYECVTPVFADFSPDAMFRLGLNVEHHVVPGLYVSFLYNQAGMLVKWFRETFAKAETSRRDLDIYAKLEKEIPDVVSDLYAFPYFEGSGSPDFIADATGALIGLSSRTTRGEILKAIMEGVTFYFVAPLRGLVAGGVSPASFVATGGGAKSDAWLQLKADILGMPFRRPAFTETGVLGAAVLAGVGTGAWPSFAAAFAQFDAESARFEPREKQHRRYQEKYRRYEKLFQAYYAAWKK